MKKNQFQLLIFFLFIGLYTYAQVSTIPFKLLDNSHVILKVKVNDQDEELDFVFDTGASVGVIDKSTAKRLGIQANRKTRVPGAGGVQTYDLAMNQKVQIGDVKLGLPYLVSVDLNRFHEVSDEVYQGIIGYSLLSQFVTKMDYEKEELVLYNSINEIDLEGYQKIPIQMHSGAIPVVDVTFKLNGDNYSGKVLFDSGAGLSLSVNTPFVNKHELTTKADKKVIRKSENLGSTSVSEKIAIESITLGKFTFDDLTILLSDDKSGVSSYKDYLGILGAKVIQRFNIILDYQKQNLYLKPNAKFSEKFEFPMSTIRMKKKNGNILIDDIEEGSDEYKAGLRKGDIILSMNDQSSKLIQFYKDLLKKEGETIKIKVETKSKEIKTVSFTLKNLLK